MGNIIVLWDSMLDVYMYGHTNRKNPESTAPLLTVDREEFILWWASNVAHNLSSLYGGEVTIGLISIVAKDSNGENFSQLCTEANISLFPLFTGAPTITKTRFVNGQRKSQLLRVDCEVKIPLTDQYIEEMIDILNKRHPEFIVISDYNKGLITWDMVSSLKKFVINKWIKILVDTKPQNLQYFDWVYLIKPNFKEFCEMVGHPWMEENEEANTDENVELYGKQLVGEHKVNLVVTRWHKWSSLVTLEWDVYHFPPIEDISVFDVTGAWDTFIATLVYALEKKYSLPAAVKLANKASWIVIRKFGTATLTSGELWI